MQNVILLFARKRITAMLFVENESKNYYKIMKRWYLFDIMLLLVGYVFCIKTSIFIWIFCCFYVSFTGLSKKCWRQHILKEWLRNKQVIALQISWRYEVFFIKIGSNNENQCFPYNSIAFAAIEILQYGQQLREAKMCSVTLYWYFPRYI